MHIPLSQSIIYRPGLMETIKFALVQYIMILLPILLFAYTVLSYLFKFRIFEALIVSDLKPKRKIV